MAYCVGLSLHIRVNVMVSPIKLPFSFWVIITYSPSKWRVNIITFDLLCFILIKQFGLRLAFIIIFISFTIGSIDPQKGKKGKKLSDYNPIKFLNKKLGRTNCYLKFGMSVSVNCGMSHVINGCEWLHYSSYIKLTCVLN
jgi:hypothetical protein